jgi:SAM-dependent methyltransferase
MLFMNSGFCPICEKEVTFSANDAWFRDHYLCDQCFSLPRERALMLAIQTYFPDWINLTIHESSPENRGLSVRLSTKCKHYIATQYFAEHPSGQLYEGIRCENLEALTFPDDSIDLHITQDVLEHVLHPARAFSEIARTLRPGGAHIFTVPLVNKMDPSEVCALEEINGQLRYLRPPVFHGNPISPEGSLVTVNWGFDICNHIFFSCGLFTHILHRDDLSKGIRAEFIEVLVTFKPKTVFHLDGIS